jgi:Ataxin-3
VQYRVSRVTCSWLTVAQPYWDPGNSLVPPANVLRSSLNLQSFLWTKTRSFKLRMSVYIYHELQESHLCGQHCLNNILQEDFFSAIDLANIAQELDADEQAILGQYAGNPGPSANVDESGNFSIQVLRVALQRFNQIDLVPWVHKSGGEADDEPLSQNGFIVNRSDHWFAIRKINNNWWNLNSTNEKPELVSGFYLSAFLHQLRQDGYSVFITKGNLPDNTRKGPTKSSSWSATSGTGKWYTEAELLNRGGPGGPGSAAQAAQQAPASFSGVGHRLGTGDDEGTADTGKVNVQDFMVDGEDRDLEEEMLLAQAISASLMQTSTAPTVVSTGDAKKDAAAEMRAKRLAALEKRGL